MKLKRKVIIAASAVGLLAVIVAVSVSARRGEAALVETESVSLAPELVARVTATGQIRPKEFVELQAEIAGVVTALHFKEGERVDRGDILLRIDPVQTESETRAQEAILEASLSESRNQFAQISVQESNVRRDQSAVAVAEAELDRAAQQLRLAQANFDRRQQLFEDNLVSRDIYDGAQNELINAEGALKTAQARLEQAEAQLRVSHVVLEQAALGHEAALSRVRQQQAMLRRSQDLLSKTVIRSPLSGVITQMHVEVGERAVPGTLNSPAATLMVIADLSVIEAEVEVDETDIVDVEVGQEAIVKVDALPNQELKGRVTEVGTSAIQRAAAQAREAREFKVVVQLENPPQGLRPGLSCTAEVTTATRRKVITVPIQALTIREFPVGPDGDLIKEAPRPDKERNREEQPERKEFEGVFVVEEGKVEFYPVETGIMGDTRVEILSGIKEGAVIVSGPYRTLRTLADGDAVKIDRERKP